MSAAEGTGILLAEDEPMVREGLVILLESEGYEVRAAQDGEEALAMFRARRPDLLLLDVMMPKMSGYDVCRAVRAEDATLPVVFLTAKDGDADELRGLNLGADDYVSKTASERVKLARIASALRRAAARGDEARGNFRFADILVDAANFRLVGPDGRVEDVSPREVEILRCLVRHPGDVLSRDFLITRFWGVDFEGNENVLTVTMHRLREKLGPSGALIVTAVRKGYYFANRGNGGTGDGARGVR